MKKISSILNAIIGIVGVLPFLGIATAFDLYQRIKGGSNESITPLILIGLSFIVSGGIIAFILIQQSKLKKSKSYIIESFLDKYIESEGANFIRHANNPKLISNTKAAIYKLNETGKTKTLDSDVYYMFLYSLLNSATHSIWAASIMGEEEWIDTPEEEEFLRLNLAAAKRQVTVERIFIVSEGMMQKMLENEAIKRQINKRSPHLRTHVVDKDQLVSKSPNLLTDIGSGFLAFDHFAIAKDVFQDSNIRGILTTEEEEINRHVRIFTSLRDYAKPLERNLNQ